ncbi:MAG: restriction endonuclease subunit S [Pseudonocardiaceae bacterium]
MTVTRLRYLLHPREVTDRTSLQVLSVYRDHGVVPKESRSDNYNKTPEDITRYQEVRVGDLVVNKMKAWQGSVGISAHRGVVSPDYLVCSVSPEADSRFFHHLLRSAPLASEFGARSKGIRPAQWRLYWEDLAEICVTLPPLDEQRRIADFLDAETTRIDKLRHTTNLQVSVLEKRRIEQFRAATTGSFAVCTRGTNVAWMPRMSRAWTLFKVGRVFLTGSGTTPRSSEPRYFDGPHRWINTGDLRDGPVASSQKLVSDAALRDYSALRIYPAGTLMVAMYGATTGRVGINAVPACVNQACCALTSTGILDTTYAFYWLLAHRSEILRLASGGGQPNISQDLVRMLRIPAPESPGEQQYIVNQCDEINSQSSAQQAQLIQRSSLLAERRQALITAAVAGQIDVTTAGGASA